MNEFDAYGTVEQFDEDNNDADFGSTLHDEVYSKGLATLGAVGAQRGTDSSSLSHLRPAKMIQDILDKHDAAKAIQDILDKDNPAKAIQDILDKDNPAKAIQDMLDKHDAAKLINKLLRKADLLKLLESSATEKPSELELPGHETPWPPLLRPYPDMAVPLAKRN